MRLEAIRGKKRAFSRQIQSFDSQDISDQLVERFSINEPLTPRERVRRWAAFPLLVAMQPRIRRRVPGFRLACDLLCLGERFGSSASRSVFRAMLKGERVRRVLVPGCYMGRGDVQYWLREGVEVLDGVDVYSLEKAWTQIVPQLESYYRARVHFQQGNLENLPYSENSFDVVASSAVLEHVRNLSAAAQEMARVLRPGGWATHDFGPLYYTFGGDHCIATYGHASGFDHLLLSDDEYESKIGDQAFFNRQSDPNLPFWARRDQFSYALAEDYYAAFEPYFHVRHVIAKVSTEALAFRESYRDKWRLLLDAGVREEDLLTKSLCVVLQKKLEMGEV